MSNSHVADAGIIRRAAVAGMLLAVAVAGVGCAPNSRSGIALTGTTGTGTGTVLSASQFLCIAGQPLDGLSNVRPPTLDEILRVINAATTCGFTPPRGYREEYAEHTTGTAAPHTAPAPAPANYLTAAQVKCIADGHPSTGTVRAIAAACGLGMR